MHAHKFSRRDFLKSAGVTLGASGLIYTGAAALGAQTQEPEFPEPSFGEKMMNKRILVAYASKAGSTAGVAEAIGRTLAESGVQVDVRKVETITDISPYDAVVMGSAIRGQKWLPEAMQFLQDYRVELSRKPFASFMVCITLSMANAGQYLEGLKGWMSPVRNLVHPVSEGYFAGVLDFSKVPFSLNVLAMRAVVLSGMWKEGDHRDWDAINAWAKSLPPLLLS
ncbi:MAG: flavodoxin domain-containing protein [Chloroflexi bacterium]|nr:flavodoxin domain-containing protein [Chloroflexota bacterium]